MNFGDIARDILIEKINSVDSQQMDNTISRLRLLRRRAEKINATLLQDLSPFLGKKKLLFRRLPDSDEKGNVTTTCSCIMAMIGPSTVLDFFKGRLKKRDDARRHVQAMFEYIISAPWTSSGLPDGNAFSSLLTLRTVSLLYSGPEKLLDLKALKAKHVFGVNEDDNVEKLFRRGQVVDLRRVLDSFGKKAPKGFEVEEYPSKSAMAYWFIDALEGFDLLREYDPTRLAAITRWCAENFARQVSLASSHHDALKDPIEMAMAACLSQRCHRVLATYDPAHRGQILEPLPTLMEVQDAVVKFFSFQLDSGIWPKYFPLFNYREGGAGSNYLFSFEVLEAIIHEFGESKLLENDRILRGIEHALSWCETNRLEYEYKNDTYRGWNSGGQLTSLRLGKPESWATAMVHMFLWKLRAALSYLIKDHVLVRYGARILPKPKEPSEAWNDLLDSSVEILGSRTTVKTVLKEQILNPILSRNLLHKGRIQQRRRSALLFGPPGTAKTSLVRAVAELIEWPLVELDPSHFLRKGLENIYSQADEIFNDLLDLSECVVFFDEMDALTQSREGQIDVTRQFLTTSMLPKLSRLHNESRVIFFMATNHLRNFDDAIKRPGRFDLLVHVRPPLWSVKLRQLERFWPGMKMKHSESEWPQKKRTADINFVKDTVRSWVKSNRKISDALNRFTPGELQSFLETFGEGPHLKSAIEKAGKEVFLDRADLWSEHYIALHSEKTAKPSNDLSLFEEYRHDLNSSRM